MGIRLFPNRKKDVLIRALRRGLTEKIEDSLTELSRIIASDCVIGFIKTAMSLTAAPSIKIQK
jgi:hypothetical protein